VLSMYPIRFTKEAKNRTPTAPLNKILGICDPALGRNGAFAERMATVDANSGLSSSDRNSMATPFIQYRCPVGSGPLENGVRSVQGDVR